MKKLVKSTALTLALSLTTLYAGSGHSHEQGHTHTQKKVTKSSIEKISKQKLMKLLKSKKIDQSWLNTSILDIKKKKFNSKYEWVVTYHNKNIKNKDKQTLYIFVNEYGKVTGANYTGK